jgi:hypothetical protein
VESSAQCGLSRQTRKLVVSVPPSGRLSDQTQRSFVGQSPLARHASWHLLKAHDSGDSQSLFS